MEDLPRQDLKSRFPFEIQTPPYLQDHFFEGKAVYPAVEALITLARAVRRRHPDAALSRMIDAAFPRSLAVLPSGNPLETQVKIEATAGGVSASLLTSMKIKNSTIRRTLEHARVTFVREIALPDPAMSYRTARKLDGDCIHVPAASIYRELIPFGPAYQNIVGDLSVSPGGALGDVSGGHGEADDSLLGSPFVLDATMHGACVWGQRFTNIVPFPVGFDERVIYAPTKKGGIYLARISPVEVSDSLLIFDAWIFDQNDIICEKISGLRMRDVTGGSMRPPVWIKEGTWKKS